MMTDGCAASCDITAVKHFTNSPDTVVLPSFKIIGVEQMIYRRSWPIEAMMGMDRLCGCLSYVTLINQQ